MLHWFHHRPNSWSQVFINYSSLINLTCSMFYIEKNLPSRIPSNFITAFKLIWDYLKDKNSFEREDQFFNVYKASLVCLHIHATHTKINLLKSVTTLIFVEIRTSIVNVPRVFRNAVAVSSDVSCPSLSWHFHLG